MSTKPPSVAFLTLFDTDPEQVIVDGRGTLKDFVQRDLSTCDFQSEQYQGYYDVRIYAFRRTPRGAKLVGAASCTELPRSLYVDFLCGKSGGGTLVMMKVYDLAKRIGKRAIHLQSTTNARGFYEKLGFYITGWRNVDDRNAVEKYELQARKRPAKPSTRSIEIYEKMRTRLVTDRPTLTNAERKMRAEYLDKMDVDLYDTSYDGPSFVALFPWTSS